MTAKRKCAGSGIEVVRKHTGGGSIRNRTWKCDDCGEFVPLTQRGRIASHPHKSRVREEST